jgi:hypothetical protein
MRVLVFVIAVFAFLAWDMEVNNGHYYWVLVAGLNDLLPFLHLR